MRAVYMLQQWFMFHKLRLWLYWACVVAYRKLMAGGLCTTTNRLNGYTVVITGADSGIGREVAKQLALLGEAECERFRTKCRCPMCRMEEYIINLTLLYYNLSLPFDS